MCRIRTLSPFISALMGKQGPVLQEITVSHLIYLTGSQDAYALWVSMWLISASCTLAEVSSDPAHLISQRSLLHWGSFSWCGKSCCRFISPLYCTTNLLISLRLSLKNCSSFFGFVLMDNRGLSQRCLIFISRLLLIITLHFSIVIAKNWEHSDRHRKPDSKTGFKAVFSDLLAACGQLLWQMC